ncbi:uncharacterized protein [Rutidosis leptorrhynchoides]
MGEILDDSRHPSLPCNLPLILNTSDRIALGIIIFFIVNWHWIKYFIRNLHERRQSHASVELCIPFERIAQEQSWKSSLCMEAYQ